jgi:hypothetical protein
LIAGLGDQAARTANTDSATWAFAAPEGLRVAAATLWRAGDADGGAAVNATYEFWIAGPSAENVFDQCSYLSGCTTGVGDPATPLAPANAVSVPQANLGQHIYAKASCGGVSEYKCREAQGDANNYAAVLYLFGADILLEQAAGPTAGNVAGELATAPSLAGTADISFTASDPGGGVYEALFAVDGRPVQATVLNDNGGRCRDVAGTGDGLPAFLYVKPCLASLSADVAFDTTRLADGTHHLVVTVIDAAGNAAPVLDRTIDVTNPLPPAAGAPGTGSSSLSSSPGAPNGTNASSPAVLSLSWKGSRGSHLTSPFGRAHTILGRLTGAGGLPIGGAQLEVLTRASYLGAAAAVVPVHTGSDGTFSLRLPGNASSRTLTFLYRAHTGDAAPAASGSLVLSVRAGIQLSVAPRISGVGRRVYFNGRLLGGPYPSSGKLIVLEARSGGGRWIKFDVIRAGRSGRYHASYRFRFPGPATYRFRVLSEAEGDYPYATGASGAVTVHER